MPDLKRLRQEHENLTIIARQLSTFIAKDIPPPATELHALRMRLASELFHHLKSEDWVLYPKLLASEHADVAATARAFCEEMGGLSSAFKAYSERWGADAIARDWRGYQVETKGLVRALRHRMIREDQELYPLLETLTKFAD